MLNRQWRYGLMVLLLSAWSAWAEVGRVTLVVGDVQLQRAGQLQPLLSGDVIRVDDRLITHERSLVQVRMQDDALISLRAQGRLHVQCYQSDCMKLNLEQGEMRQVTGSMGQANKQNFRLNTPVAAIGVRGTDFITKTDAANTYVRVLAGAIVAAPFDEACQASQLGVCASQRAALLTANDPFILHLQPNVAPVVQPGEGGLQATGRTETPAVTVVQKNQSVLPNEDVLYVLRDHPEILQAYRQQLAAIDATKPPLTGAAVTPALQFSTWDKHTNGMATDYLTASAGRSPTVGDAQHLLWRAETLPYLPTQGVVNYQLSASQATLTDVKLNTISPAQVTGGSLRIDFDQRQLSTALALQASPTQSYLINSTGALTRNDGIFMLNTAQGGTIAGAISTDNQQVAYMLNQPLTWQVLKAITTWQAR